MKTLEEVKNEIIEDTYNFLVAGQKSSDPKKIAEIMPTVWVSHLVKILANKAKQMTFDKFTHYYVEHLILSAGNRGSAKYVPQ